MCMIQPRTKENSLTIFNPLDDLYRKSKDPLYKKRDFPYSREEINKIKNGLWKYCK